MKQDHRDFEQRIRSALDTSVGDLDAGTRTRLAAMRAAALAEQPVPSRWKLFGNWAPAALAAGVIFAVVGALYPLRPSGIDQIASRETDGMLELLYEAGPDEAADPEFYLWLDALMMEEEGVENVPVSQNAA